VRYALWRWFKSEGDDPIALGSAIDRRPSGPRRFDQTREAHTLVSPTPQLDRIDRDAQLVRDP
jgi:hypothetical protein